VLTGLLMIPSVPAFNRDLIDFLGGDNPPASNLLRSVAYYRSTVTDVRIAGRNITPHGMTTPLPPTTPASMSRWACAISSRL